MEPETVTNYIGNWPARVGLIINGYKGSLNDRIYLSTCPRALRTEATPTLEP